MQFSLLRSAVHSHFRPFAGVSHYASVNSYLDYQLPTFRADSFYDSTVEKYAALEPEVLSLSQMLEFGKQAYTDSGKLLKSARYVHRELPIRLARRLLDLQLLPYIVVANPHIKRVYNQYYISFETIRRFPEIRDKQGNAEFTQLLRQHLDQHAPMLESLATGLRECKSKDLVGPCLQMDSFFDTMISSRVTRRVLAEQHLHFNTRRPGYAGVICLNLDVREALLFAIQKAKQVCIETYGRAPEILLVGEVDIKIPYIPAHIDYMLYELLKNSMRAVVEHHVPDANGPTGELPPVQVLICDGYRDLTFRIADQGGGIHPSLVDRVWSYGFTTIGASSYSGRPCERHESTKAGDGLEFLDNERIRREHRNGKDTASGATRLPSEGRCQMAGLGFGLPLSRLYARYFGGDLKLQPIPGYGTDAYLTIKKLNDFDWQETSSEPSMLPLKTP